MATNTTRVVIPCRISFANIWEPKSINDSAPKYSVSCIIPKTDTQTIARIKEAVEAARELGKVKRWGGKIPPTLKTPLRDGDIDRPDDENYAGCYFVNASSKDAPQIVDQKVRTLTDPLSVGSGDYCNVSVNFYGYNANGNRGIACGLGNVQLVQTGERFGGRSSAASDFEVIASADDNDDNELPFGVEADYL